MYAELSNFIKAICHPGGQWSEALRSPGTHRGSGGEGVVSPWEESLKYELKPTFSADICRSFISVGDTIC